MAKTRKTDAQANRFGIFEFPCRWQDDGATVETQARGTAMSYRRQANEEELRLLCSAQHKLRIEPLEPLFLPQELTRNLLVEFEEKVLILPDDRVRLDLTFPLEIGVLIPRKGSWRLLDAWSFAPQKFTLYGDPASGVLCKYWKSRWVESADDLRLRTEGWLRLTVRNTSSHPAEVGRVVCSGHQLQIYHDGRRACCSLAMKITARNVAEVEGDTKIPIPEAKKAFDLFSERKLLGVSQGFVMERNL